MCIRDSLYSDFGLLTCNEEIGADTNEVFKQLTGLGRAQTLKHLWQAPFSLQPNVVAGIRAEAEAARAGKRSRIKMCIRDRAFLVLVDLDGHEAQNVFRQTHLTLHLLDGRSRRGDVHQGVVGLAVLVDAVGEGLEAPVLNPADGPAICGDHTLVLLDKGIDLLLREILPGKEHMLVQCHVLLSLIHI